MAVKRKGGNKKSSRVLIEGFRRIAAFELLRQKAFLNSVRNGSVADIKFKVGYAN